MVSSFNFPFQFDNLPITVLQHYIGHIEETKENIYNNILYKPNPTSNNKSKCPTLMLILLTL